jgi:hypothetical protein
MAVDHYNIYILYGVIQKHDKIMIKQDSYWNLFPPLALQPNADYDLLVHEVSLSHITTHHSR